MTIDRRQFLTGAGGAALAGTLTQITFAQNGPGFNDEILIYVFLRGGIDGLSVYAPASGHPDRSFYENLRPSLSVRLPISGTNAMLPLADGFGINRAASGLHRLWLDGELAIVHATGLPIVNRSHFEAERFIELGTPGATEGLTTPGEIPGSRLTTSGWLARHLNTASNLPPASRRWSPKKQWKSLSQTYPILNTTKCCRPRRVIRLSPTTKITNNCLPSPTS